MVDVLMKHHVTKKYRELTCSPRSLEYAVPRRTFSLPADCGMPAPDLLLIVPAVSELGNNSASNRSSFQIHCSLQLCSEFTPVPSPKCFRTCRIQQKPSGTN